MDRRVRTLLAATFAVLVLLTGCGVDDERATVASTTPNVRAGGCLRDAGPVEDVAYATVPGVDPELLSLDVYPATAGCPAPVVVWAHGGGWQVGDKRNQTTNKVHQWRAAGYTVVSVNYRLTDPAAAAPVRAPTHSDDVASAIAWVQRHIGPYGGDPDRIAVLGHSAGAQIVATVATDPRRLGAHGLGLDALRCAGALDTEGYDVGAIARTGNPIYRQAFGDDPALWSDLSPITHVAPDSGIPPFLVVERGSPRRRSQSGGFATRLRDAGVPVTVVDAAPLSHAEVNSAIGRPGEEIVTPPLTTFLAECFRLTS